MAIGRASELSNNCCLIHFRSILKRRKKQTKVKKKMKKIKKTVKSSDKTGENKTSISIYRKFKSADFQGIEVLGIE